MNISVFSSSLSHWGRIEWRDSFLIWLSKRGGCFCLTLGWSDFSWPLWKFKRQMCAKKKKKKKKRENCSSCSLLRLCYLVAAAWRRLHFCRLVVNCCWTLWCVMSGDSHIFCVLFCSRFFERRKNGAIRSAVTTPQRGNRGHRGQWGDIACLLLLGRKKEEEEVVLL